MIAWILSRLKWLGLLAAVSPFVVGGLEYNSASTASDFAKNGVEVMADVDGGTRTKRRRSGTSFSLDLSWQDKAGKTQRAEKVSIPRDMADRIIVNDQLTVDKIKILYIPDDPSMKPVVAGANARNVAEPVGAALGVFATFLPISLLGGALFYFLRRREQRQVA
jgi:hypothetical protein